VTQCDRLRVERDKIALNVTNRDMIIALYVSIMAQRRSCNSKDGVVIVQYIEYMFTVLL